MTAEVDIAGGQALRQHHDNSGFAIQESGSSQVPTQGYFWHELRRLLQQRRCLAVGMLRGFKGSLDGIFLSSERGSYVSHSAEPH